MSSLLVVAGEASGDRAAAAVAERLSDVSIFGFGGPALESRGVELVRDLRGSTALGIGETAARAWNVGRAFWTLMGAVKKRRPRAALLVGYTEFNARLAPYLRASGVRVVWYGAPQVWAWRPRRAKTLQPFLDRMAVVLPFEERIWRDAGVDADYVGHPALEGKPLERADARRSLGMTPYAAAVGILPGSRPHEVTRLLPPMLDAYERVRSDRASVDARVLVASSLDERTRSWLHAFCDSKRIRTFEVDPYFGAMRVLAAFDATLCASGTASLEAALARAVPVVAYRVGLATELAARILLRAPYVALPNVLLGRRAFPELLQRDVKPAAIAEALANALDRRSVFVAACAEVEEALGQARTPSVLVAKMLSPWLDARAASV